MNIIINLLQLIIINLKVLNYSYNDLKELNIDD